MNKYTIVIIALFIFSGCVQQQAQVEDKSEQFYGREHEGTLDSSNHDTYSQNSEKYKPGYARPVAKTPVSSVGISELPPAGSVSTSSVKQEHRIDASQESPFGTGTKPVKQVSEKQIVEKQIVEKPVTIAAPTPKAQIVTSSPVAAAPKNSNSDFIWPVNGGKVVKHFDAATNDGINISANDGEPIFASSGGTVIYVGNELKGYGNMVILSHDKGIMTAYANASSIVVKKNAVVKQGDIIAYVGTSGGLKTPQLHFSVRDGKNSVDPEKYLPK